MKTTARPAERLLEIREKLGRLVAVRASRIAAARPAVWVTEAIDVLLDQWVALDGVPKRPADGWMSERRR